ncbi:hypothetical protein [Thermocatellispora tengchongensis]|uniref:hypothetical protein n=1 Tax=Thermocatellispora tengchongensis TaxID=1073253 RepID=UPI0036319CB4
MLLINPGGPGIAGLGAPALVSGNPALKDVAEHYDLVGFDPRGTGASSPIDCGLDDRQVRQAQLPWPQPGGSTPTPRSPGRQHKPASGVPVRCFRI